MNASGEHRLHFQALEAFQFFSADHLTEIGEAESSAAPTTVAATKVNLRIVVLPFYAHRAPRLRSLARGGRLAASLVSDLADASGLFRRYSPQYRSPAGEAMNASADWQVLLV